MAVRTRAGVAAGLCEKLLAGELRGSENKRMLHRRKITPIYALDRS